MSGGSWDYFTFKADEVASMALTDPELRAGIELQRKEIDRLKQHLRDECDRVAELRDARPCTCHPDDNPPQPCAKQYALGECMAAAAAHVPNGQS